MSGSAKFDAIQQNIANALACKEDHQSACNFLREAVLSLNDIILLGYENDPYRSKCMQIYDPIFTKYMDLRSRSTIAASQSAPCNALETLSKKPVVSLKSLDANYRQIEDIIRMAKAVQPSSAVQSVTPEMRPVSHSLSEPSIPQATSTRIDSSMWTSLGVPYEYAQSLASFQPLANTVTADTAKIIVGQLMFPSSDTANVKAFTFEDVIGQSEAKEALRNSLILPKLNPSLFTGNRKPPSSILLLGAAGNGKTILVKAAAQEARTPLICLSASSIMSKYVGDSENNLKTYFNVAAALGSAILFIDEIDSLLTMRGGSDSESSRRVKTEFLTLTQGLTAKAFTAGVVLIGATNRPQDIDDAAMRRFEERIPVTMPNRQSRRKLFETLLMRDSHSLRPSDIDRLAEMTSGYSYSDVEQVVKKAALMPLKSLGANDIRGKVNLRRISFTDYEQVLRSVRPTVSKEYIAELKSYLSK